MRLSSSSADPAAMAPLAEMDARTPPAASKKRRYMDIVLSPTDVDAPRHEIESKRLRVMPPASPASSCHTESESTTPATPPPATSPRGGEMSPKTANARANLSASQTITLDMLRPHFEKPLAQVAQAFGICVTLLKKICRKNGLPRWPHRQIIGLRKSIASMEQAIDHFEGARRASYAEQLDKQRAKLKAFLQDPTKCSFFVGEEDAAAYAVASPQASSPVPQSPPMPKPYIASFPRVVESCHVRAPSTCNAAAFPLQAYRDVAPSTAYLTTTAGLYVPPLRHQVLPPLASVVSRRW